MGPWHSLCRSTRVSVCHYILMCIRTDQIMPLWYFGSWHHSHVFLQETTPAAVVAYNDDDDDDEEAEDMEAFEQSGMLEQVDKVGHLHVCVCVCVRACMCACVCICVCACLCTCMYMCMFVHLYVCAHKSVWCDCVHACGCLCRCLLVCTSVYVHVCVCAGGCVCVFCLFLLQIKLLKQVGGRVSEQLKTFSLRTTCSWITCSSLWYRNCTTPSRKRKQCSYRETKQNELNNPVSQQVL